MIGATGGTVAVAIGAVTGVGVIGAIVGTGVGVGEAATEGVSVREQPAQTNAANKPQAKMRRRAICMALFCRINITGTLQEHYDFAGKGEQPSAIKNAEKAYLLPPYAIISRALQT